MEKNIFERITLKRNAKGLSKADMARACDITQTAYANIEKGAVNSISLDVAKNIAIALNENFNQLFDVELPLDTNKENLEKIEKLEKYIAQLQDQLQDKKELVELYKVSLRITERRMLITIEELSNIPRDANYNSVIEDFKNRINERLKDEFGDFVSVPNETAYLKGIKRN